MNHLQKQHNQELKACIFIVILYAIGAFLIIKYNSMDDPVLNYLLGLAIIVCTIFVLVYSLFLNVDKIDDNSFLDPMVKHYRALLNGDWYKDFLMPFIICISSIFIIGATSIIILFGNRDLSVFKVIFISMALIFPALLFIMTRKRKNWHYKIVRNISQKQLNKLLIDIFKQNNIRFEYVKRNNAPIKIRKSKTYSINDDESTISIFKNRYLFIMIDEDGNRIKGLINKSSILGKTISSKYNKSHYKTKAKGQKLYSNYKHKKIRALRILSFSVFLFNIIAFPVLIYIIVIGGLLMTTLSSIFLVLMSTPVIFKSRNETIITTEGIQIQPGFFKSFITFENIDKVIISKKNHILIKTKQKETFRISKSYISEKSKFKQILSNYITIEQ